MADYNRIIMVGNLTRDPELKNISSSQTLCRLGLASNRQFRNSQTGTMVQEVCFVDIDVWGRQAESCNQYLQKGRAVLIEGRLKFDTWQDNNGNTRSKHTVVADRVVFLSQQSSNDEVGISAAKKDPSSELEKELLGQIDKIKEKAAAAKPAKTSKVKASEKEGATVGNQDVNKVGDVKFQDAPPFEDDLPF